MGVIPITGDPIFSLKIYKNDNMLADSQMIRASLTVRCVEDEGSPKTPLEEDSDFAALSSSLSSDGISTLLSLSLLESGLAGGGSSGSTSSRSSASSE